jgi:peptide subunit release factor 1 (eRF1)
MKIPQTTPRICQILQRLDPLDKEINAILMDWDPIGIGKIEGFEHNLWEEYLRYIPKLKKAIQEKEPIKPVLDWIEGESIGIFYTTEENRMEISNRIEQLSLKEG